MKQKSMIKWTLILLSISLIGFAAVFIWNAYINARDWKEGLYFYTNDITAIASEETYFEIGCVVVGRNVFEKLNKEQYTFSLADPSGNVLPVEYRLVDFAERARHYLVTLRMVIPQPIQEEQAYQSIQIGLNGNPPTEQNIGVMRIEMPTHPLSDRVTMEYVSVYQGEQEGGFGFMVSNAGDVAVHIDNISFASADRLPHSASYTKEFSLDESLINQEDFVGDLAYPIQISPQSQVYFTMFFSIPDDNRLTAFFISPTVTLSDGQNTYILSDNGEFSLITFGATNDEVLAFILSSAEVAQ